MSQMRLRWKERRSGEDGEERRGAGEAETMAVEWGQWGGERRAQEHKTKGEGKREANMGVSERSKTKSDGLLMRSASSQVTVRVLDQRKNSR